MKIQLISTLLASVFVNSMAQQTANSDSLRKEYFAGQKAVSNRFSGDYYPNRAAIYSLGQKEFFAKVDSFKAPFSRELAGYSLHQPADTAFISAEQRDIDYFFDRIILDYPYFHEIHTGEKVLLPAAVQKKLDGHLADFNRPDLLASRDVKGYIEGFLRHASSVEVKKPAYEKSDNKRLDAYLNIIPVYFSNQECRDFWEYYFINNHLGDWGSKHVEQEVSKFLSSCKNDRYKRSIDSMYTESITGMKDHLVKTYKTVNGYDLDLHIFLPDSMKGNKKYPVMVYFSGGSWTQGNPEWAFYGCAAYAKKGWVGVSVEYRLADRHETTPFEAVKDARSAIRWLRMHANDYNIDTNRIVASGNSAGGHLVLTTALANGCNEAGDDLHYSASPNLLLINSGVYNLYAEDATDWISRGLKDKNEVKKISPMQLLRKGLPPMLIIHGTMDQSVDYSTAKAFTEEVKKLGNDIEFHTLEGAPHPIWFDRRFSAEVFALRKEFLKKHGYE